MFQVCIPEQHYEFLNEKDEFISVDVNETKFKIEHSLISIRKWEQKWHKPFLTEDDKTKEETMDYIRCMTITPNIDQNVYNWIPSDVFKNIMDYIQDPSTATWFNDKKIGAQKTKNEVVTAEIIYYWMISLSIPIELEKWHLNQLLTLIKVVSIKNDKDNKLDPKLASKQRVALNKARRAKYHSKG